MVPVTTNLDQAELVPHSEFSIFLPFIVNAMGPTPGRWFIPPIPEEEEANVKDSLTPRLSSMEQNMGGEAIGFGGQPALPMMGGSKVYTLVDEDTGEEEKIALVASKTEQKGGS